jgi:putative endonuclease
VVDRDGLENRCTLMGTVGSNPTLSATLRPAGLRAAGHLTKIGRRVSPEAPLERRETGAVWYVYILELTNGDISVGSTNDLRRRFASHKSGDVVSTRKYLPATLKSYVAVANEELARKLERYFKSGSGKAFTGKRFLNVIGIADGEL